MLGTGVVIIYAHIQPKEMELHSVGQVRHITGFHVPSNNE